MERRLCQGAKNVRSLKYCNFMLIMRVMVNIKLSWRLPVTATVSERSDHYVTNTTSVSHTIFLALCSCKSCSCASSNRPFWFCIGFPSVLYSESLGFAVRGAELRLGDCRSRPFTSGKKDLYDDKQEYSYTERCMVQSLSCTGGDSEVRFTSNDLYL